MTDWRRLIGELILIKQAMADVDARGLWEYRLPTLAASESDLAKVEGAIGEPLDPSYRSFLSYASGWPAFVMDIDLFGVRDLLGGSRFSHAMMLLDFVDDRVLKSTRVNRADLLPIAASQAQPVLMALTRRSSTTPGMVIWYHGDEVDRYQNFGEFFLSMVEYNRLELQALREELA